MEKQERLNLIKKDFENSNQLLHAISDENRQKILLVLLENCVDGGIRVEDIAKEVNLSRPAVSHHLKMLLEEGFVTIIKDGTKNYYHLTTTFDFRSLKSFIQNIELYLEERKEK